MPANHRSVASEQAVRLLNKEACGNFLITDTQTHPQQIWKIASELHAALTQISIFNDASSKGGLEVVVMGADRQSMHIYPGNTGTITERNVTSIYIAAEDDKPGHIEGKYCVSSFFRLSKKKTCSRCKGGS